MEMGLLGQGAFCACAAGKMADSVNAEYAIDLIATLAIDIADTLGFKALISVLT
jgi:hypothetical protein